MKLRDYLEKNGIKNKFFAEKVGISYQYLWRLLNEKHTPSLSLIMKIKKFTNDEVDFIDWVDESEQDK